MSKVGDFQIGNTLDGYSTGDLLAIGTALQTLSAVLKTSAVAKDLRDTGQITGAVTAEANVTAYCKRLPPSWRWKP